MQPEQTVLQVQNLCVALPPGSERVFAVQDVSLDVQAGETVCVVGESGSGKSVLAHATMGLLPPGLQVTAGKAVLSGIDLFSLDAGAWRALCGVQMSMVFQEPMTALDVTTQAQILTLMRQLQQRHGLELLFITHDFGVVADIADRVVVMQHGQVVETGSTHAIIHAPEHPYTRSLFAALPRSGFSGGASTVCLYNAGVFQAVFGGMPCAT